jgi:hypothetical protein
MRFRRAPAAPDPEDVARLGAVLLKLDPWAFWTVELDRGSGASFAVLGVTGAFAVTSCGLDGYLVADGRRLLVDGKEVRGFREVKKAARALRGKLLGIGASTSDVVPLIVLMRAVAGAPRDQAGVRVVRPEDVVRTITARERVLDPSTAELLARRIGRVLPGAATRPVEDHEEP